MHDNYTCVIVVPVTNTVSVSGRKWQFCWVARAGVQTTIFLKGALRAPKNPSLDIPTLKTPHYQLYPFITPFPIINSANSL